MAIARSSGLATTAPDRPNVFARDGSTWVQERKLLPSDNTLGFEFGAAVALSGGRALVSKRRDFNRDFKAAGAVYAYDLVLTDGQSCGGSEACQSGLCVDGVCCGSACDEACASCNQLGSEGVCSPVAGGTVPASPCGGHLCNGDSTAYPRACAGGSDCASTHYCQSATACIAKATDGQRCNEHVACVSGHCIDGVCCESACDEGCGSCVAEGAVGRCTAVVALDPGTPSCDPYLCDGAGLVCPSACAGHEECAVGNHCAEGRCASDGVLGASCTQSEACSSDHCTDGVCCSAESCGAYRCNATGNCAERCQSSTQCATGYQYSSAAECVAVETPSGDSGDGGGCGCALVGRRAERTLVWEGILLLGLVGRYRRRRRSSASEMAWRAGAS